MIKREKLLALVLANTVFAFLIDFYVGYSESWLIIILMEVPIIIAIVLAMKGYKWAYIFTIIYYFLRSFNFYFEDFYFLTKNGINFEISVNSVGINVVSLFFFILLFFDLQRKFDSKSTRIIRTISASFIGLVICLGLLTAKSKTYDQPEYKTPMVIEQDTLAIQGTNFVIEIPEDWQSADNYKGSTLFAVSPVKDSLDVFRENINIQVFRVNLEIFGSEFVGNHLFSNGKKNLAYDVEIVSKEFSEDFPDFYTIEYTLSDSTTNVKSKMFCTVQNKKAYSIIFTDSKITFDDNLRYVFEPILTTFKTKNSN